MASNHTQYTRNKNDRNKDDPSSSGYVDVQANSASISRDIIRDDAKITCETNRNSTGQKNDAQQKQVRPVTSSSLRTSTARPGANSHRSHHLTFNSQSGLVMNDALILRHRRAGLFKHGSRVLEFMAEDKIARNKMDLIHWSEKSSTKSTFMMAFSPNGQRVASTHGDHRIYICDLNTGQLVETLEGHPKTPWCFAWHPTDKDTLASGCLSGEVRVWDLRTKACELWTSEGNTIITSISFHPTERILAIATANAVHFWDWFENAPFAMTKSPNEKERVKYVEFDSSGTKLITGITNCTAIPAYSRDSLQNRIIDSYLNSNANNIQQPQQQQLRENMTQNSEISSHQNQHEHHHNNHHHRRHRHHLCRQDHSYNNIRSHNESLMNFNQTINRTQVISSVPVTPSLGQSDLISPVAGSTSLARSECIANSTNITSTITMTLSKIACLYKNLEALEDSIRKTYPYNASSTSHQGQQQPNNNNDINQMPQTNLSGLVSMDSEASDNQPKSRQDANNSDLKKFDSKHETGPIPAKKDSCSDDNPTLPAAVESNIRTAPNAYEPLVVLFDELLENVQLSSIVVGGRTVDITSLLDRNPIDLSNHLDYVVHFESINQVNQNFIRISKLMSSVRLYRQIIQQILSSNSGSGHYQPNQFLTAQSLASHSSQGANGAAHHIPIVFRYGTLPGAIGLLEHDPHQDQQQQQNDGSGGPPSIPWNRPAPDPILAIQFRNCARNLPLGSVCKVDLLNARSICMLKAQQYLECSLANSLASNQETQSLISTSASTPSSSNANANSNPNNLNDALAKILIGSKSSPSSTSSTNLAGRNDNNDNEKPKVDPVDDAINDDAQLDYGENQTQIIEPFYLLLNHLQRVLSNINQAPLTTSNVHTQIASLRRLLDQLLTRFYSMIQTRGDASRLVNLIHEISRNLTGRTWNGPLGRTFDELRLDVIHTFCMVDLTLHLARQMQLLQMQRISAIARIRDPEPPAPVSLAEPVASTSATQVECQQTSLPAEPMDSSSSEAKDNAHSIAMKKLRLKKRREDALKYVMASCSFTTDANNTNENSNVNDGHNSHQNSSISDDNVTENPPGKRRNDDKSSPSHLANKKSKFEPSSRTEMIDSSRQQTIQHQQQASNPVYDSPLITPLNTTNNNNHNNNNNTDDDIYSQLDRAANFVNNRNRRTQSQLRPGMFTPIARLPDDYDDLTFETSSGQSPSSRISSMAHEFRPISTTGIQIGNEPSSSAALSRVYVAAAPTNNLQIFMRIIQRIQGANGGATTTSSSTGNVINNDNHHLNSDNLTLDQRVFNTIPEAAAAALSQQQAELGNIEVRRRALSHDHNSPMATSETQTTAHAIMQTSDLRHDHHHYHQQQQGPTPAPANPHGDNHSRWARRYFSGRPPGAAIASPLVESAPTATDTSNLGGRAPSSNSEIWPRQHQSFHIIIPSHPRQNVLYMTLPTLSSANYRLQCWPFYLPTIPNIKDNISSLVAQRCRIDTNASVDISKDGNLIACLVPHEDTGHPMILRYELRIISLRAGDFGTCHYAVPQGPQAFSVSLSPSARYVIVGLANGRQSLFSDGRANSAHEDQEGLSIAKVFKLNERNTLNHVRDIKIKRQDLKTLNAIKWMPRGIVYNVGQHPIHHHRYQPRRSYQ